MLKKYIGDRDFYKKVLRLALPCAMSQLLLSCRNIITSIMVSSIGMVTVVGNATNILNLHDYLLWGIEAGSTLFAAQFFGAKQYKNMAKTQGLCLSLCLLNTFFWIFMVYNFGDKLLLFYLNDVDIMKDSLIYLKYVVLSLIPLCVTTSFKSMYQSMHKTNITFIESLCYVVLSILNSYVFIFVLHLGIKGAGMAVILTESLCALGFIIYSVKDNPVFLMDVKECFSFDFKFIKPFLIKVFPIALNEIFFGFGQSLFNKAYGMLGSASMDVIYICSEILSLALFIVWGYGEAVSIIVGTLLGEGRIEQAKEESKYHLGLSFMVGVLLWTFMVVLSPGFLKLYNINDIDKYNICIKLLWVYGFKAFIRVYTYVMFCTLKAGGDSKTFNMLDSGIMYTVGIPIAFLGVYLGIKDVVLLVLLCQIEQVVRVILTLIRYNSYKWANNLTKLVN